MSTVQKFMCVAALMCVSGSGLAQRSSELSVDLPDSRTMAIQNKVERLFTAGKYERAFPIYRDELAAIGDKYAQYMVGYMYQTGLGVTEDRVLAAAWYQLAAERETREFEVVRDRLLRVMSQDDVEQSRNVYHELRVRYCDLAVLLFAIKRDWNALQDRTGTRLKSSSSPVAVVANGQRRFGSSTDYYGGIRKDLEARLNLLKEIGGFQDLEADLDRINIHELERRVLQQIESEAG